MRGPPRVADPAMPSGQHHPRAALAVDGDAGSGQLGPDSWRAIRARGYACELPARGQSGPRRLEHELKEEERRRSTSERMKKYWAERRRGSSSGNGRCPRGAVAYCVRRPIDVAVKNPVSSAHGSGHPMKPRDVMRGKMQG